MRHFLIMWSTEGLECLQDISEFHPDRWDKDQLLGVMMGKKYKTAPIHKQVSMMIMRARANTHRHYEIYVQETDDNITASDFSSSFNLNPQFWADFVRANHSVKLYDNRIQGTSRVIT